ncbi:hypothetical protein NMG60_11031217 [Bertholletia excelsa]
MEDGCGNRSPFGNQSSSRGNPLNRYPFFDNCLPETGRLNLLAAQSLEAAFSALNITAASLLHPPPFSGDFGAMDSVSTEYSFGGEGFLPASFDSNVELQRLRVQNAVNGQICFGGAHRNNRVVGEAFRAGGWYPTAASEQWQTNDVDMNSCYGFDGSYLQHKKQMGKPLNSEVPNLPCSSRGGLLTDSDQFFERRNVSKPNFSLCPDQYLNCLPLEEFRGQIVPLAKDQYGCRLLQKKFEHPTEQEIQMVLSEVIYRIDELMGDQFGNYLFQKLVSVCDEGQITNIIVSTRLQLIRLSLNPYGTRSVQKLLEHITSQQQISLVMSALRHGVAALATDQNGHHVIEHCLSHFSNEDNKYLISEIAANCFKIATNRNGCCVIQSCVAHSQGEYRELIMAEIIANALLLAEDPYGNYVVQNLLGLKIPDVTQSLLRQLEGSFASLSCNKYASNVVEKCLTDSGEKQSSKIIMELLRSPKITMLLVDPFGNFVIQSALSVSKGFLRNALLNIVKENAPVMRTNLYGKKVLDCLKLRHGH